MSNINRLRKSFQRFLSSAKKNVEVPAFLGNIAGTVKANVDQDVYVVLQNGEELIVRNVRVPNVPRLPVIIGYDASNPNLLQVLRARDVYSTSSYPDIPNHADSTHQWPKHDVLWVRGEQILPGLVIPSTGLTVQIMGFVYYLAGWHSLDNQAIDLTAEIPTTGAQYLLVEVDNAGAISFNAGSVVNSREMLTYEDIPAVSADKLPLFAVKVYAGQTGVIKSRLYSDIVDLRWSGVSSGGTWGSVWGSITGTLSDQTDLQTALNAKQNTLTFPLSASQGGTGVNNTGTLTNANNTTITGGGTLALGGFTLTIPATGTAALLGTANVFTQQQSITIATGTAPFAITSTTVNTNLNADLLDGQHASAFLTDALSDGTTYGRKNGVWSAVSAGVTDHSLLSNLTYAASGHTGFAGTGVANTFTRAQFIDGSADETQLRVQGHSTMGATSYLQTWEQSTGTVKALLNNSGVLALATNTISATTLGLEVGSVNTSITSGQGYLINGALTTNVSSASSALLAGMSLNVSTGGGTSGAISGELIGMLFNTTVAGTGAGSLTKVTAHRAVINHTSMPNTTTSIGAEYRVGSSGAGNVLTMYGSMVTPSLTSTGNITTFYAYYMSAVTKSGAGNYTNMYGLYLNSLTNGTSLNYAIYTNAGLNRFGDQVGVVGSADRVQLQVTGHTTQTNPLAYLIDNTSATNVIRDVLKLEVQSTGTAAAGFGAGILFSAETATASTMQTAARIYSKWEDAANATRKGALYLTAYDTAERIGLEVEASGSAVKLGFFGGTTQLKQTGDIIAALNTAGLITSPIIAHGSMYKDDSATSVTISVADTYYEVGVTWTGGTCSSDFTFQNAKELKCNTAGTYQVDWSMTVSHNNSDRTSEGAVMVNSTVASNTVNATRTKENGVDYSVGGTGIITLAVNDVVKLCVSDETGTGIITVNHGNLKLSRVA